MALVSLPKPERYEVTAKGAGQPILGSRREQGIQITLNPNLARSYVERGFLVEVRPKVSTAKAKTKVTADAPKLHNP